MKVRMIAYWATTTLVALELLAYLGDPVYLLTILGCWKLLGAIVLVAPRLPRLKEWAYAGAFFELTGAAVSFMLRGDVGDVIGPLFLALLAIASWALRPQSRTLGVLFPTRDQTGTGPSYGQNV
jgi:hypothetical protein